MPKSESMRTREQKEVLFLKKRLMNVYSEELQYEIAEMIGDIIQTMEETGRIDIAARMQMSVRTKDPIVERTTLDLAEALALIKLFRLSIKAMNGEQQRLLE